jgi:hypothetical protein
MSKITFNVLLLSTLVVLLLAVGAPSQSTSKSKAQPLGEIITEGDSVKINGTSAQRGTTVFEGSAIQTGDGLAFVNLTSGGGVLSIGPGSEVKITREQSTIVAYVIKGSVTVRSQLASTVIAPDRVVTSGPDNLYTVSVSNSGTQVGSLLKSVAVKAADGAIRTVAAQVPGALMGSAGALYSPNPERSVALSPDESCTVTTSCRRSGDTLDVSGRVSCTSNAIGGTRVTLHCYFRNREVGAPQSTMTNRQGDYRFVLTSENVKMGGSVWLIADSCGKCGGNVPTRSNRCTF